MKTTTKLYIVIAVLVIAIIGIGIYEFQKNNTKETYKQCLCKCV